MTEKLILKNERTGHKLLDMSCNKHGNKHESIMIRTAIGAGWELPTKNFDPEDFRKLADYLEKIRGADNGENNENQTVSTG